MLGIAVIVLKFIVLCCIRVADCVCILAPSMLLIVVNPVFGKGEGNKVEAAIGNVKKLSFVIINGVAVRFHPILFIAVGW